MRRLRVPRGGLPKAGDSDEGKLEPRPARATARAARGVSLTVLGHLQDVADQRAVPIEGLGPRQVDGPLL